MNENETAKKILDAAFLAHTKLGPGLLELTQLRLSELKLGLLINFGETHLKNGVKRIINGQLEDEPPPGISL
jgi:hypothetical protein